jgi:hypothetical protein
MKPSIASFALMVVAIGFVAACSSAATHAPAPVATPTPVAQSDTPTQRMRVVMSESFSPRTGEAAVKAFIPEVAPVDSGGECFVTRTAGSGATIVSASFPRRTAAHTQASIMFDSSGRLIRFSERRGAMLPPTTGMTPEQRDSTVRATNAAMRSTLITIDYAIDQAIISNRGGGRPTDAILSNVRAVEKIEKFGPIVARVERVRRLCGV